MFERFFPGLRPRRAAASRHDRVLERLAEPAREAAALGQEEARRFGHNYTGTEHLLLGLLRKDDGGVAARALASSNVRMDDARERVEGIVGHDSGGTSGPVPLPFTPRSKRVLEMAEREAVQLGHSSIGAEHLLLGLLRQSEGVAAMVLADLGADPDEVRRYVLVALQAVDGEDDLDRTERL